MAEGVVEENGLLVHIADELAKVVDAKVFHVDAVYQHLSLLHVVVTGDEVYECRLATATLSHQCDGLALGDGEVDVLQHPLLSILE